jgi:hypothetical protein
VDIALAVVPDFVPLEVFKILPVPVGIVVGGNLLKIEYDGAGRDGVPGHLRIVYGAEKDIRAVRIEPVPQEFRIIPQSPEGEIDRQNRVSKNFTAQFAGRVDYYQTKMHG